MLRFLVCGAFCCIPLSGFSGASGMAGTLSFSMMLEEDVRAGIHGNRFSEPLVTLPGVGTCFFGVNSKTVFLEWKTEKTIENAPTTQFLFPEMKAGEIFVQLRWDAKQGVLDAYLNDFLLRVPETRSSPWNSAAELTEPEIRSSKFKISGLSAEPGCRSEKEVLDRVPEPLCGMPKLRSPSGGPLPVKKGALLYKASMDSPESISGWVMEGPGEMEFEAGRMRMKSEASADGTDFAGHIVHWCPLDFPNRFVAEWDVIHESEYGLLILFFAANGQGGKDLFDPSLPVRDGTFKNYTSQAIDSYHISYYANTTFNAGRRACNFRKNTPSILCAQGPVPFVYPMSKPVKMTLIKDGSHIQLLCDGSVYLEFNDVNPERHGVPYRGGKIGFRQMKWSTASYSDFNVWALE